ncbi:TetR/AcrR family transcriptional regulator [Pelomicrobium sp. G1]|uniref:TetR/AcrR family transcriptional regulator n=1 Tax=unclassified Pelomicrobium TaxID=2815318 RepID=UPI000A870F24
MPSRTPLPCDDAPDAASPERAADANTKDRILDAAEALFMERGFVATSLRMITARAGVNLAAVNYHFGSKEELIKAVFSRRLGPLNQERVAILDQLEREAEGKPLPPEKILEAFLCASLRLSRDPLRGGAVFLRLLGQAFAEPAEYMRNFLPEQYREVVTRYKAAFARALPQIPEEELVWRLHFLFGAIAYSMAGHDALRLICSYSLEGSDRPETIIRHLIPFAVGGLTAPLPRPRVVEQAKGKRKRA